MVLNGVTYNMTEHSTCGQDGGGRSGISFPSFVDLPAPISDLRWRPLTADPTEQTYLPYCISPHSGNNSTPNTNNVDERTSSSNSLFLLLHSDYPTDQGEEGAGGGGGVGGGG